MKDTKNNYAFIDSQNLNLSIRRLGWQLDFGKFHIYLKEKYAVKKTYLFIGYVEGNQKLYTKLQELGYIIIFKPTLKYQEDKIKGNCDAELVLHAMIEFLSYNKAIIVSGDGDFHCLIEHLIEKNKLRKLLIPSQTSYSALLKKFPSEYLAFVSDLKKNLEYKKKRTP